MDKDFCQALVENDRPALKIHLDRELATIPPSMAQNEKFEHVQQWLAQHDCVATVEIVPGVLRSNPPIKEFIITLHSDQDGVAVRNIGLLLLPDELKFDYR